MDVVITNVDGTRENAKIISERVYNGKKWYLLRTKYGEVWRREDVVQESGRNLI